MSIPSINHGRQRGSDSVMDPLKMAYGVKKPLEFKEGSIKAYPEKHMRYYPVDQHGKLDEWGAIIKHQ